MEAKRIIEKARFNGRTALTEAESKRILRSYGVPVVEESVARDPEDAVLRAEDHGYPVVLKGLGTKLTHKTERGLVHLNLKSAREVRAAAEVIARNAGEDLEGYLVQPMIRGRRELTAGMFCDPQFGPVIMFGLGGIMTEALGDVVFRLAPLSKADAESMIGEIRSRKLLKAFRGEPAVSKDALVRTLMALSRLAEEEPGITEVDINPLVVEPDGRVTAVDALIIIGERVLRKKAHEPVDPARLRKIFYPESVAFIGASAQLGKWGSLLLTNTLAGGYSGEVYLVNPKGGEIAGRKVYRSVRDIPGPVDLGVVTVPAAAVPALIPEFKEKGIGRMLLITSGFGESGKEGRALEAGLVKAAEDAGILILGPNTMGICNPHAKLYCTPSPARPQPGSVSLISQSGNLGIQLLSFAYAQGIGIRCFSGSGNEAMITLEDYLQTLGEDDLTKTAVLYIESVKDGRRFFSTAKEVSHRKPVIALKGGRTEAGSRAAASHTGAMAADIKVFSAACRQAGVIVTEQPLALLDLSAAFTYLPLPKGKRVAIMTLGGGWGVVATDVCIDLGLEVPRLTPDVIARIDKILPPYWSKANPVDMVGDLDITIPKKLLKALVEWDGCDAVIHLGVVGRTHLLGQMLDAVPASGQNIPPGEVALRRTLYRQSEEEFLACSAKLMEKYGKPIMGVFLDDADGKTVTDIAGSDYKSVAFPTPERAVRTLFKMVEYREWLHKEGILKSDGLGECAA